MTMKERMMARISRRTVQGVVRRLWFFASGVDLVVLAENYETLQRLNEVAFTFIDDISAGEFSELPQTMQARLVAFQEARAEACTYKPNTFNQPIR